MIRRAKEKDIDRLLELLIQVNNVHACIRPDIFIKNKTKYTAAELKKILKDEKAPIFVAADGDDMVTGYGFTRIELHGGEPNINEYSSLYIDDICVDEAFRGRGTATEIFEYIESYARSKGFHNITLNVWEGNDGARSFYEKMDMKILKTTMEKLL